MAPVIHCVRHGQGWHNVGGGSYNIQDPLLTPLGIQQCEQLRQASFSDQSHIALVAASPLSRALETATLVFAPALANSRTSILALPDIQETSDDPCDIGLDPPALCHAIREREWRVDTSLISDGWNVKHSNSEWGPQSQAISARARRARVLLRHELRELINSVDPVAQIILVTHGSFLHFFTEDWEDAYVNPGTGWRNCEVRSYTFANGFEVEDDEEARLMETMESRRRRGLAHPMPDRERQASLFAIAMEQWGKQGLQRPDLV